MAEEGVWLGEPPRIKEGPFVAVRSPEAPVVVSARSSEGRGTYVRIRVSICESAGNTYRHGCMLDLV